MAHHIHTSMDSPSGIELSMPRQSASNPRRNFIRATRPTRSLRRSRCRRPTRKSLWARGIDWPCVVWIAVVHVLALDRAVLFQLARPDCLRALIFITGSVGVCMGYHRCLTHGAFQNLSAGSLVAGLPRRPVGRRLGADLGRESSQASRLQRQGRRSAFAARRQMVEPHAVVHAELRPALAPRAGREVRARYSEGQSDGRDPLPVPAVAPGDWAWCCF